jgi:hypothetical protein
MGIVEITTQLTITCDNPDCPNPKPPDANSRNNWLIVTRELDGAPAMPDYAFCTTACMDAFIQAGIPKETWGD